MKKWTERFIFRLISIVVLPFAPIGTTCADELSDDSVESENEHLLNLEDDDESPFDSKPQLWEPEPSPPSPFENNENEPSRKKNKQQSVLLFPLSEKASLKNQLHSALNKKRNDEIADNDEALNDLDFKPEIPTDSLKGQNHVINNHSRPVQEGRPSLKAQIGNEAKPAIDTAQTAESDGQPRPTVPANSLAAEEEARLHKRAEYEKIKLPAEGGAAASSGPLSQTSSPSKSVISSGKLFSQSNEIAQNESPPSPEPEKVAPEKEKDPGEKTILVNFNNVSIIEYLRFISRYTNKNFIFDEADLQFNVTIISEEPTTIENILTALVQELRIHGLILIEQGNNLIIHNNLAVNSISKVVSEKYPDKSPGTTELITRVFTLNTLQAPKAAELIRPLASESSIIEPVENTNYLIVTDLSTNITKIAQLIKSLDAPAGGMVVGQYVVKNGNLDVIVQLAQQIIVPLAPEQTIVFVPHSSANSIFIVSSPYLVERSISLLQRLDQTQGTTRIYTMDELESLRKELDEQGLRRPEENEDGRWEIDKNGNWEFIPKQGPSTAVKPKGHWYIGPDGTWRFGEGGEAEPGLKGPEGQWTLDPTKGVWVYQIHEGETITPETIRRKRQESAELPLGHIQRTRFYIHKLQFRSADAVATALQQVASSLATGESVNTELLQAIQSVQPIEGSNSLVFTGAPEALKKVKELIQEIDVALRQVFIEMLIINTTIDDSLEYSVNLASRFSDSQVAGTQAFLDGGSALFPGFTAVTNPVNAVQTPLDAAKLVTDSGYTLGIIGRSISKCGVEFGSIAALVRAVHDDTTVHIMLNPKILAEDNQPAEIFVGINTPFLSQSIANDQGSILTSNVEYRDVGTRMKITPLLGNSNMITLIIEQELSDLANVQTTTGTVSQPTLLTTTKSTTTTRVHLPDGYFLVVSGLINDRIEETLNQVPCLGSAPLIGGLFKGSTDKVQKRNIMTFIRPKIIETYEEYKNITQHEQDIYRLKTQKQETWKFETDKALEFLNIKGICDDECGYSYDDEWLR